MKLKKEVSLSFLISLVFLTLGVLIEPESDIKDSCYFWVFATFLIYSLIIFKIDDNG